MNPNINSIKIEIEHKNTKIESKIKLCVELKFLINLYSLNTH